MWGIVSTIDFKEECNRCVLTRETHRMQDEGNDEDLPNHKLMKALSSEGMTISDEAVP